MLPQRNAKPLMYIILTVISVLMLVFVAFASLKLVSLDKALSEERDARKSKKKNIAVVRVHVHI